MVRRIPYDFPPMLRRHRARRGPYSMATPSMMPSVLRSLILLLLLGIFLYGTARGVLWLFSGSSRSQTPAQLTVEEGGTVNVSIDDGLLSRTEDTMKLYEGDRVVTSANGFATIKLFDGTLTRLDNQTELSLSSSDANEKSSTWSLTINNGSLWVKTPMLQAYSGSVTRTILMPRYAATLTSDTEAVFEESKIMIFSADGAGVQVTLSNIADPIIVGEGQQFTLPDGEIGEDPYVNRSAIEPLAVQRAFITKSRTMFTTETTPPNTESGATIDNNPNEDVLTITTPTHNETITTATVKVSGSVGPTVKRVRINGFDATITNTSFNQELSLQEKDSTILLIEAFDARGLSLAQRSITIFKGSASVPSPSITSPATGGQTYRTQKSELSISGTTPAGTVGMMVNDYRLQLFRTGDTTWSYLASKALGNLKDGTNIFNVVAVDAAGNRSAPVTLTIVVDPLATEGVVGGTSSSAATTPVVQETELPKNDPLMPGTVSVTAPAAGSTFTATGSEFVLAGIAPKESASVWVNGYKLQLYKPGATFWNYIAKTAFGTLKAGKNVYKIVARDASNKILDVFEYTVTYNP